MIAIIVFSVSGIVLGLILLHNDDYNDSCEDAPGSDSAEVVSAWGEAADGK